MPATDSSRSTRRTRSRGAAVVEAITGWRSTPVSHLVYTHGHADHVGGSVAFDAAFDAMTVVGHEHVARRFDRYRETNAWNVLINARQFGGVRADFEMGDADEPDFIPKATLAPTHVVGATDTLTVGDRSIELHHARGETDDHLWGWMPDEKWLFAGDFVIWNFPNAGNPQKVQRYPLEWAGALRDMASRRPEILLPAHGLPVAGADRIEEMLTTIAGTLEGLVSDVVAMMNAGEGARHHHSHRGRRCSTAGEAIPATTVRRARVRDPQRLASIRRLVGRRAEPTQTIT